MTYHVELTEEAEEFLESLPYKIEAKARRAIDLLKEFGYLLSEPHSKKLKSVVDLHELIIKSGTDICRLFYFFWKDKIYIVTSGYMKKDMKTDVNQIDKAIRIMKEFKEQEDEKN